MICLRHVGLFTRTVQGWLMYSQYFRLFCRSRGHANGVELCNYFSCNFLLLPKDVLRKSCSLGYLSSLAFPIRLNFLLCYLLIWWLLPIYFSLAEQFFVVVVAVVVWNVFWQFFFQELMQSGYLSSRVFFSFKVRLFRMRKFLSLLIFITSLF